LAALPAGGAIDGVSSGGGATLWSRLVQLEGDDVGEGRRSVVAGDGKLGLLPAAADAGGTDDVQAGGVLNPGGGAGPPGLVGTTELFEPAGGAPNGD
jgi:hypothetical protein